MGESIEIKMKQTKNYHMIVPNEPKTCGGIPRASSNACKRPTSGSSASGSAGVDVEPPKLLPGNELFAPASPWLKVTFAKLSDSPLNAIAELADNAEPVCDDEPFAFDSETDTTAVCDVDGWLCVIESAESRAAKQQQTTWNV